MKLTSDKPGLPRQRYYSNTDVLVLILIVAPFIAISFFNHPLGDDFWITALVRRDGFIDAQKALYDTVSARYSLLTLASLAPLTFGNFWLYKAIPIVFVILFFIVFATLVRTVQGQTASYQDTHHRFKDSYFLSAAFTALYLNVMPGIGEGLYWFSSLASYQAGLLTFMLWLVSILRLNNPLEIIDGHQRKHKAKGAVCVALFLILLGFNEPLALIASISNLLILVLRFRKKKSYIVPLLCLLLSIPVWYYLLAAPSFRFRYVSTVRPGTGQFIQSAWFSIRLSVYHVAKVLINPLSWVCIILGAGSFEHLSNRTVPGKLQAAATPRLISLYCIISMFLIGFVSSYYSPTHVVSLRLTNMIIFLFLCGLLYLLFARFPEIKQLQWPGRLIKHAGYKYPLVFCLLIIASLTNNNFARIWKELLSGTAYAYDQELSNRYRLIETCASDTCVVPTLKNRPASIRYSKFDNDVHIGEYFNKTIIYSGD